MPSRNNKSSLMWMDGFIAGSGESGYIAVKPDNDDIVFVGAIGSSPGGGNCLQRYDHRTQQLRLVTTWPEMTAGEAGSRPGVPFRLDLSHRLLSPRSEHAIRRRESGLQIHRRGSQLAADQPGLDARRSRDAQGDGWTDQSRCSRCRDLCDSLCFRRIAARARRLLDGL